MAKGDTKTNQYLDIAANGTRADLPTDTCCETRSQTLIREVAERIMDVEDEVEELKNNPDVVDIVATYADLQAYDTQHLTDKDIIRVLQDETHDGESTYYRYNKQSDTWTYVGTVGDYYTKTAADAKFQDKLTAGSNITISDQNVISATDTTYSNFTGTDGTAAGTAGLVPAPTTTDGDKYLKGDGTWGTVQAGSSYTAGDGINISAQDVISATNTGKARVLTTADYNWPTTGTKTSVALWLLEPGVYTWEKSNGPKVDATLSDESISAYGYQTALVTSSTYAAVSIYAFANSANASMFYQAYPPTGERLYRREFLMSNSIVDNLTSTANTKVLSANQGKVLKDLVDSLAIRGAGAPTTSTAGQVGTLYEDTTNGKLYICTDATNPYVWEEVGGGSGVTKLTSADYNYPANNPDGIAVWLLDEGFYSKDGSTKLYRAATSSTNDDCSFAIFKDATNIYVTLMDSNNTELAVISTSGQVVSGYATVLTTSKLVQATGTSTILPMSQNAVTSMVYADPSTKNNVNIGGTVTVGGQQNNYVNIEGSLGAASSGVCIRGSIGASSSGAVAIGNSSSVGNTSQEGIAIGKSASASGAASIAMGGSATTSSRYSTVIGGGAKATSAESSIALGYGAATTMKGQMDISTLAWTNTAGYNNSQYRLLTGLYDPQTAHDAATKGYVDGLVGDIEAALNAINNGGNA